MSILAITSIAAAGYSVSAVEDFYFNRQGNPVLFEGVEIDDASPFAGHPWPVVRYQSGPPVLLTGSVGMEFRPGVSADEQENLLSRYGLTMTKRYAHQPSLVIAALSPGNDPFAAARALDDSGRVVWAEPTIAVPVRPHAVEPNDPVYGQGVQIHLRDDIHAIPSAWETTTGREEILIAVVDTGVDPSHPELTDHLMPGVDILDPNGLGLPEPDFEDNYHGTAVAGLVAASTNNGEGIAGICWNCGVLPVRLIDRQGTIYVDRVKIYDAFRAAIEGGAWIINNSWGPLSINEDEECVETPFSEFVSKGVQEAREQGRGGHGTPVVWSAGNEACPTELQPHLSHPDTLVVSALDGFGNLQPYSNHGYDVDISAVEGNFTTDITGAAGASDGSDPFMAKIEGLQVADYMRNFRGTSAAAPVVTGALALMFSANPNLTFDEALACLRKAAAPSEAVCPWGDADQSGRSPCFGFGLLDAETLVEKAHSGECGGRCSNDDECIEGTWCDPNTDLCVFEKPVDPDGEAFPEVDGGEAERAEEGGEEGAGGCGCALVGVQ